MWVIQKNVLWLIHAISWNYLPEVTTWFICSPWPLPLFFLCEYTISILSTICFYLHSVPRVWTNMKCFPWGKRNKDPRDKWISQSKGKMLFSGIQHSHGIRAHKKWSISTGSRSQFPIQRITQERVSELVKCSGTAAESNAGGNTIYKSEELQWILNFFSFLGKWQKRLSYKMRSDSNYDLLEVFQYITIGDGDKQSYLGQEGELNKTQILKEHKRKRPKIIELFS